MHRAPITILSAAITLAAFSLSGCARDAARPTTEPLAETSELATPQAELGPLPAPQDLSAMLSRLADPGVRGADKIALVSDTAPPDAAALDRFATALRDTGFSPVTITASEVRWSDGHPGNVVATIKVTGPADTTSGEFTFPMEFRRTGAGWQLTRDTAEELLAFGNPHTDPSGPPPPGPTPPS